jgi:hypothetical protein
VTFLAPWLLLAAAATAAAVVALHFLAWQRPRSVPLPTARFVPDRPARAASRAKRPRDLLLLALRVLLVLLVGAAFARPVLLPNRRPVVRVVAVDRSRAVDDVDEARDSARAALRPDDVLVLFDSAARVIGGAPGDSLAGLRPSSAPGSISAALVAALRAAAAAADRADSVELVLVSPLAAEEVDAATGALRALWRGRARLARVAARTADTARPALEVRGAPDDPVVVAVALAGARRDGAPVRVVRGAVTAADSAWARRAGRVLVRWPADSAPAWRRATPPDTVGAVLTDRHAVVARLPRPWRTPVGHPVAWWVDGEPAAAERPLGGGCVRDVAVQAPEVGDEALTLSFQRLVVDLAAPCGGWWATAAVPDSVAATLAGTGPLYVPPPGRREGQESPLVRWLLAAAVAVAIAEMAVRARKVAA